MIISFILDSSFCAMFYLTSFMQVPLYFYILKYVITPAILNSTTYIIAKYKNNSDKLSDEDKNFICSMALCTVAGIMSIFHSYYAPLWVAPSVALVFCSVFHNKRIYKWMLLYSMIIVALSCVYICTEDTTLSVSYIIEQCVVAEALTIVCGLVTRQVSTYQKEVLELTKKSMQNEEEYKNKLDYDTLTGVHSRVYMDKIIHKLFGVENGQDIVAFAIIDLDDFKKVNDTYGHDNGNIVLKVLGSLLNDYATKTEYVGRFGGEEFIIVFKDTSKEQCFFKLEKIRRDLNLYVFDFMDEKISFSAGLVCCKSGTNYKKVFKLADEALYISKKTGKNKITINDKIND